MHTVFPQAHNLVQLLHGQLFLERNIVGEFIVRGPVVVNPDWIAQQRSAHLRGVPSRYARRLASSLSLRAGRRRPDTNAETPTHSNPFAIDPMMPRFFVALAFMSGSLWRLVHAIEVDKILRAISSRTLRQANRRCEKVKPAGRPCCTNCIRDCRPTHTAPRGERLLLG